MNNNLRTRFIKGVTLTGLGTFLQIALGFFGLIVAIRILPKEEFGIFVLIQVIALFFAMLSSLALENISVTKLITSVNNEKKPEVTNTAILYKICIMALISLVILLCRPLIYSIFKSAELILLAPYIVIFFVLSSLNELHLSILQGFHQYDKMALAQIINGLTKLLLIIVLLILFKTGLRGLISAFLLSFTASILFQYFSIPIRKRFNFNKKVIKEIFLFGLPLGFNSMLTFMFTKIDRFMIGAMMSPIGVAYYEVASKIPDSSTRMFEAFKSVFFPNMAELFAKGRPKEAEKLLSNSIRMISFITIFSAFIIALFSKDIVRILFSERYMASAPALSFLMLSLSIMLTGNILGTSLVALGQSDKPVKINSITTLANIIGNLIMIPRFGIMGAVYATMLSACVAIPINVWFLKKSGTRVDISKFFMGILGYSVFGILILLIKPEILVVKFALIILFVAFCFSLSIVTVKDIRGIFEIIKSHKRKGNI